MGGHLKSGQHFNVTFLSHHGTQENGCDIIPNLIQNAIDLQDITAIIRNERELLNNMWTFARLQVRQLIEIFTKRGPGKPNLLDELYATCLLRAQIIYAKGWL